MMRISLVLVVSILCALTIVTRQEADGQNQNEYVRATRAQEFEVCRCLAGLGGHDDPDPSTLYYSSVFRKQSDRDDYSFVNYVMNSYRHGSAKNLAPPRCHEFSTASDGDDWKTQDMNENDVFVIVDTRWRP